MRHTSHVQCHYPGCAKTGFFEYITRREQSQGFAQRQKWLCNRHAYIDTLLTAQNLIRTHVVESKEENGHRYWGNSGYVYGPGFNAYADDFPAGTKLTVIAKIELP